MWNAIRTAQWVAFTRLGTLFLFATVLAAFPAMFSLWSWKVPLAVGCVGAIIGLGWGMREDVRDERRRARQTK
jgi:hypothetical protein